MEWSLPGAHDVLTAAVPDRDMVAHVAVAAPDVSEDTWFPAPPLIHAAARATSRAR